MIRILLNTENHSSFKILFVCNFIARKIKQINLQNNTNNARNSVFHLISWCGNFVERHSFRRVSGESPERHWHFATPDVLRSLWKVSKCGAFSVPQGYVGYFWSVFSLIWTKYGDLLRKSPYPVQIWEYTDKRLRIWHFSHSSWWEDYSPEEIGIACLTAKNTVISPDFLVWKFCGKT